MRSVSFKDKKFFFFFNESHSVVLNQNKEKLSLKEVNDLGFKSLTQFCLFLDKLESTRSKIEYYDEQRVCELISDNLLSSQMIPIGLNLAKTLLKGINYQIVKLKDHSSALDLLQRIASKNNLVFNKVTLDLKVKKLDLKLKKYLRSPWGEYTRECIRVCPLLVEPVLKALDQL